MQRILIDTDPGQDIDDLLAIWFAALRPELQIKAITTVTWPSDKRVRLVKRLLRYLGRDDIPVAAGMELPLRPVGPQELAEQHDMSRSMNHYAFALPEEAIDDPSGQDAVDLIIRTVEQNAGEIVLACIGPLTNIATALRRRPDIAGKIQYIAMMGGEMVLNRCEHNVAYDYVASDIVLTSGVPIHMGTWSVTRQFTLTMAECDVFRRSRSPLAIAMGKAIDVWHPGQNWKPGPVMYDLFPMVHAFDRTFYKTQPMSIRVETRGDCTRGMTVAGSNGASIHVTTEANAPGLRELFLSTVMGAEATR